MVEWKTTRKNLHSQHLTVGLPRVIQVVWITSVALKRESVALTRRNIVIRDERICQYCEKIVPFDEQTLDHVLPKSKGGKSTWENLVLACRTCNTFKADFLLEECGMKLLRQPVRPKAGIQYQSLDKLRPEWRDWAG